MWLSALTIVRERYGQTYLLLVPFPLRLQRSSARNSTCDPLPRLLILLVSSIDIVQPEGVCVGADKVNIPPTDTVRGWEEMDEPGFNASAVGWKRFAVSSMAPFLYAASGDVTGTS